MTRIVAIIPAFNEEKTIAKVVVGARKQADAVIVCDDGSSDMTAEIAGALGVRVIRHERNMGKGEALRDLVSEARRLNPAVVVTIDADSQHDPADIPRVAEPVLKGEADIVIGARFANKGAMPRERRVGNRVLDEATSRKAGVKLEDTQSGFRAYSGRALDVLDFRQSGMAIESQTLIDAAKAGLKVTSVPISTTYEGITPRRNPVSHFSGVLDYVLGRTVADSPLLYLGLPGFIAIVAGIVLGVRVVAIFEATRAIAVGSAIISVSLVIVGVVLAGTGLIIKFVKSSLSS